MSRWLSRLAARDAVAKVNLSDPSGESEAQARALFGDWLAAVLPSPEALFETSQPEVAVITLEPQRTPDACAVALEAGSHVLYEKPGAVVDAYALLADAFIRAAHGGAPTPCEPEAGARMLEFTVAVRTSAETRQTQPVRDPGEGVGRARSSLRASQPDAHANERRQR